MDTVVPPKVEPNVKPVSIAQTTDKRTDTKKSPGTAHHSWRARYQDSWYPEVVALVLSCLCVVAIIVILQLYDGKPNPQWKVHLTLNAIISALATTSKVALIFVTSNSIGQLKWVWFLDPQTRSLIDIETFDSASRGPFGAILLLWNRTRTSFASFGAILTLLAVAYDPFVQLIISYETAAILQPLTNNGATINSVHSFLMPDKSGSDVSQVPGTTVDAINAAFWGANFSWNPLCSGQECSWSGYQTLAWHASCYQDKNWTLPEECNLQVTFAQAYNDSLSPGLEKIVNCSVIPNNALTSTGLSLNLPVVYSISQDPPISNDTTFNLYIDASMAVYTVHQTYSLPSQVENVGDTNSVKWYNSSAPLFAISAFRLEAQPDFSMQLNVTTCAFDMFWDTYDISVINETFSASLQDSHSMLKSYSWNEYGAFGLSFYPSRVSSSTNLSTPDILTTSQNGNTSIIQVESVSTLGESLGIELSAMRNLTQLVALDGIPLNMSNKPLFDFVEWDGIQSLSSDKETVWETQGPAWVMDQVSAAMNSLMLNPSLNPGATQPIYGRVSISTTVVRVAWPWVTLPFGLCLAAILLFVVTVYISHKAGAPLWKSSVNAFFYHGVSLEGADLLALKTISEMDAQARTTLATLTPVGANERLILETTAASEVET